MLELNRKTAVIAVIIVAAIAVAYYYWSQRHPGASMLFSDAAGCAGADAALHAHAGAHLVIDNGGGVEIRAGPGGSQVGAGMLVSGKPVAGWNKIIAHACNAKTQNMDLTVQSVNPHYPSAPVDISVSF